MLETSEPVQMKEFRKPSKEIKDTKMQWKEKIKAHQDETYSDKEKSCLKEESTKYDLLEKLKKEDISGPFTIEDEIKRYLLHHVDDDTKNKRIYDEVRYAGISYMLLKPTAAVFRLKRNHKNLTTEEYAESLIACLSNACCCKTITVEDLNNVMRGIMSRSVDVPNEYQSNNNTKDPQVSVQLEEENNPIQYQISEHLIPFWVEGNETKWHLGVVECTENENPLVSYMIRTDTKQSHGLIQKVQKFS